MRLFKSLFLLGILTLAMFTTGLVVPSEAVAYENDVSKTPYAVSCTTLADEMSATVGFYKHDLAPLGRSTAGSVCAESAGQPIDFLFANSAPCRLGGGGEQTVIV